MAQVSSTLLIWMQKAELTVQEYPGWDMVQYNGKMKVDWNQSCPKSSKKSVDNQKHCKVIHFYNVGITSIWFPRKGGSRLTWTTEICPLLSFPLILDCEAT